MMKPSRVVTCLVLLSTVLLAAGCDKLKAPAPSTETGASAPRAQSPSASAVK
jgi:hypothetical protein